MKICIYVQIDPAHHLLLKELNSEHPDISTVRAYPCRTICQAPCILLHAGITYLKTAWAVPAEWKLTFTYMTYKDTVPAQPASPFSGSLSVFTVFFILVFHNDNPYILLLHMDKRHALHVLDKQGCVQQGTAFSCLLIHVNYTLSYLHDELC